MTILALDPGLATCGYAVVRMRTARVLELGTLVSSKAEGVDDSTDRARRVVKQVATLAAVAAKHGVTTIAAEAMSFGGPGRFAMAVSLCLSWGAIAGLAHAINADLFEVTPKQWQHAVLGSSAKVNYDSLFALLSNYVQGQISTLESMPVGQRNHALDAVGVGIYAAMVAKPTRIRTVTA